MTNLQFLSQVETKPNFPDKIQAYGAGESLTLQALHESQLQNKVRKIMLYIQNKIVIKVETFRLCGGLGDQLCALHAISEHHRWKVFQI